MIFIPGLPPLPAQSHTRLSRELGTRIDNLVRDYKRQNPELTDGEIRAALLQSAPAGDSPEVVRRRRAAAVGVAAAVFGAFVAIGSNGGTLPIAGETWKIVGIVAAVGVAAIALIVRARRD